MTDNIRRVTIPNPQIKDAADQYCEAALLLLRQPPGSGVLLPALTTAAFSLELYLKSLNAQDIYNPLENGVYLVTAQPAERNHQLLRLYEVLATELKEAIALEFQRAELSAEYPTFESILDRYNTLFVDSRYAFERSGALRDLKLNDLSKLISFLRDFVQNIPRAARVEWS